jgi:hypothetical protein
MGSSQTTSSGTIVGAAVGGGAALGGAAYTGNSATVTELAALAAPLHARGGSDEAIAFGGCGTAIATILAMVAFGVSSVQVFLFSALAALIVGMLIAGMIDHGTHERWNSTELPQLKASWQRSVMCMRCGEITDPKAL